MEAIWPYVVARYYNYALPLGVLQIYAIVAKTETFNLDEIKNSQGRGKSHYVT